MIKRLMQKWFNRPPAPDTPYITDTSGEKFWIRWKPTGLLYVSYHGDLVGRVNLSFKENGEFILADIIIIVNSPRNRRNLRHRGLGKAMLQETIRFAREQGAKEIWGWIEPDEHTTEEYLAEWYSRQGFQVTDDSSIFLDLKDVDNPCT